MPVARKTADQPGLWVLLFIVSLAWGIELLDRILPGNWETLGVQPRTFVGLRGIPLSAWLHGDWAHLIANTLTFLGLGFAVLLAEGKRFVGTTVLLVLVSGAGTWLIGRPAIHIGASGLIYAYFGYILARAVWERRAGWAVMGIVVGVIYGGMIWGVLPTKGYVSWEAHLAGLAAGLWLGRSHAVTRRGPVRRGKPPVRRVNG